MRGEDPPLGFDQTPLSPAGAGFQNRTPFRAHVVALTDIGCKRKNNEDNFLVFPLDGEVLREGPEGLAFELGGAGLLLAVADGMGGHRSGEVASQLCVSTLGEELVSRLPEAPGSAEAAESLMRQAVEATHHTIYEASQGDPALYGMGCTLTAALLHTGSLTVAQVGDSRAYLFREGRLSRLTEDQTVGNLLHGGDDSGLAGERVNDILTQAMGAQPQLNVAMSSFSISAFDSIMVCCDGLYKVVPGDEIAEILALDAPLRERAEAFIRRAIEKGGPDNITVVLADIRPGIEQLE